MSNGKTIIHVHFNAGGSDLYFGSLAAIYDVFQADAIGASYKTLANFGITPDRPYTNKIVTIKRGELRRKVTNRKNPFIHDDN